jgi:hypothetical protein
VPAGTSQKCHKRMARRRSTTSRHECLIYWPRQRISLNGRPAKRGPPEPVGALFRPSSPSSIGDETTLNSERAQNASSRPFVRSTQQSEQAAARRRAQEVDDND